MGLQGALVGRVVLVPRSAALLRSSQRRAVRLTVKALIIQVTNRLGDNSTTRLQQPATISLHASHPGLARCLVELAAVSSTARKGTGGTDIC